MINYRKAHDGLGRAVIMVDQKEIFSICTIKTESQLYLREWEQRKKEQQYDFENEKETEQIWKEVYKTLKKNAIYAQYDFFSALEEYFSLSIEKALRSSNSIVKMLCMIDRRVGKRTLLRIEESILEEHRIIKYFYQLRCEAEGIQSKLKVS
ncbi:hypothetical protein [Priestia endophytica]|uniref:SF0329 family protein n=1 Tax=Priestia endophytica TaxID=135735 RepID=UPI00227F3295|nr:hypothetical protein [Priestia endophytica]MCY8235157.1 hypothetical protein [Priestia endophytica]